MKTRPIHTRRGKRQFIRDLCNRIKKDVISKVGAMPSEWDGHELRVYLAETFEDSASMSILRNRKDARRLRAYRNHVIVNNL